MPTALPQPPSPESLARYIPAPEPLTDVFPPAAPEKPRKAPPPTTPAAASSAPTPPLPAARTVGAVRPAAQPPAAELSEQSADPLAAQPGPAARPERAPARAAALGNSHLPKPLGRRYGFQCVYCSSRLAASENQGGAEGTCPTCGSKIVIPILDRFGRLIDPRTNQVVRPDPHPVHAYAAAGERAPDIRRKPDGTQEIVCPVCASASPISANNCRVCGNPFTIEAVHSDGPAETSQYGAASLVFGIVSIFAFCLYVPGPVAIVLGCWALYRDRDRPDAARGQAIAGIVLGVIGTVLSLWLLNR